MELLWVSLGVVLPILPALNIGSWDMHSLRVLVLLGAAVLVIRGLARRRLFVPVFPAVWLFVSFVLVATLSFLWAQDPAFALRKALFLWSIALPGMYLGFCIGATTARDKNITLVFAGAALCAGILGTVQFFSQFIFGSEHVLHAVRVVAPWLWGRHTVDATTQFPSFFVAAGSHTFLRAFFPFPDPHTYGLFLGFVALPALAALFLPGRAKFLGMAVGTLSFSGILFSFSRGSWIACVIALAAYSLFVWRQVPPSFRKAALGICVAAVLTVFLVPAVRERALSIGNTHEGSAAARLVLWRQSAEVFGRAPLFGVGLGNLASALAPGQPFYVPTNAHNLFLELAAETGVVGAGLFVAALFVSLVVLLHNRTFFAKGLAASLVVFLAHSIFETTLYSPQVLFLVAATIGIASALPSRRPFHRV